MATICACSSSSPLTPLHQAASSRPPLFLHLLHKRHAPQQLSPDHPSTPSPLLDRFRESIAHIKQQQQQQDPFRESLAQIQQQQQHQQHQLAVEVEEVAKAEKMEELCPPKLPLQTARFPSPLASFLHKPLPEENHPNRVEPYPYKPLNLPELMPHELRQNEKLSVPLVEERLQETESVSCTPDMNSREREGKGGEDCDEDGYEDNIRSILEIAKGLPKNVMLHECLDSFSNRIDIICGNVILHRLWRERLFLPALSFFEWMRLHDPCLLDARSLCTIFTLLGEANMVDRAVTLFENMKDCKELQSVQVFNALMSALTKHGRYDEAMAMFQEMSKANVMPDSVSFSILIVSLRQSKCGVEDLWNVFSNVEQRKIRAGYSFYGALIKAFCEKGLREEALMMVSEIERRGLILNVVIYNTLIDAYGKANMLEEAEGLFSEMKERGVHPTVSTYNSLIDAYGKQDKFEVAEALLEEMLMKGLKPDARSYSALISAYGRMRLSEKAANAFMRMKRNGVSANTFSYSALIHAYIEDGWHKKAGLAFESMLREGLTPTVQTYTSLLHGYRQTGDLEKLKDVWKRMRKEKCNGTRATFNVLLDAFARQGCYAEARDVIFEFARLGYKPDGKTYNMLLNAYARGGQHSKVPQILTEMHAAGFAPDSFTYTSLIFTFLRVRDFEKAFMYHEEMCRHQQLPDKFTYRKLRAILDEKFEIKLERNMKAGLGLQQKQYDFVRGRKKVKKFRKRHRSKYSK